MSTARTLFHLLPTDEIAPAQAQGWYQPSSFEQEGFIHCSSLQQRVPTANRHYPHQTSLSLLEIDPTALPDVRVENLSGGAEAFPHIYSCLPWSAVRRVHTLQASADGIWIGCDSAIALFDAFDPVDCLTLTGRWQGYGFPTGHPLDGLLEATGWYGKEFITAEEVHPLLFTDSSGKTYKISPSPWMLQTALQIPIPKADALKPLFSFGSLPFRTEHSQARLRMMAHRSSVTASMIYDRLPVHDIFKQIDADTLLGWMDCKGFTASFFFVLVRESSLYPNKQLWNPAARC